MSGQATTLKEGEAPKSDDEDEQVRTSFMRNTMVCSTMVSGEASETDDEEEDDELKQACQTTDKNSGIQDDGFHNDMKTELVTELDNIHNTASDDPGAQKSRRQKIVYKFDSPFHRKLRERNLALRSDLVEGVADLYKSVSAKLNSSVFHLTRAQQSALDVAENTRFMVEDLDTLCKQMDLIILSDFLPSLQVQTSQE